MLATNKSKCRHAVSSLQDTHYFLLSTLRSLLYLPSCCCCTRGSLNTKNNTIQSDLRYRKVKDYIPEEVSQMAVVEQLQGWQEGKPKYPVLQESHRRPTTFSLQRHWPPNFSHSKLLEPSISQWHGNVPWLYLVERENTEPLQKPANIMSRSLPTFLEVKGSLRWKAKMVWKKGIPTRLYNPQ